MSSPHSPLRFVKRRPHLAIALALGLAGLLVASALTRVDLLRSFLIGWNVTVWTYLALIGTLMARASHARARAISEQEDPSAVVVLALLSLIAVASLAAVGAELAEGKDSADLRIRYGLAGITLLGSWLMLNTLFSFHYTHMYFRALPGARPLRFPDDPPPTPDYWDFLYFSFTVAVAAQTSDIAVVTPSMRKAVLAHSVLAFVFNVAILGATVNLVSGLLTK